MTLTTQTITLLAMIGMGIFFAASFDTYNRLINRKKNHKILVFMNDLLFWCVQALLIFYVLYLANYGEIRLYLLLALLCGYAAYQALFKPIFLKFLEIAIRFTIRTNQLIKRSFQLMIMRPIYWLALIVKNFIKICVKIIFTIAKYVLKAVLSIVGVFIKPIFWIISVIWSWLPRKFVWRVEAFWLKIKGKLLSVSKFMNKLFKKWTKKEK